MIWVKCSLIAYTYRTQSFVYYVPYDNEDALFALTMMLNKNDDVIDYTVGMCDVVLDPSRFGWGDMKKWVMPH